MADVKELKAMAYDRIAIIEKAKVELAQINEQIGKLLEFKEEEKKSE